MLSGKSLKAFLFGCALLATAPVMAHPQSGRGGHTSAFRPSGSSHAAAGRPSSGGAWHGGAPVAHFAPHVAPHVTTHIAPHFADHFAPRYSARFTSHVSPAPRGWSRFRGGRFYGPWGPWWWWGSYVSVLPWYFDTFWWGGVPYYYADRNYYLWDDSARQYAVVAPPRADEAGTARADGDYSSAAAEPMVYPANGQAPDQVSRDRYECHRWAAEQSGFDPTQTNGGVAADDAAERSGSYRRAEVACLSGRGYTVR